jgi:replication factor C large subunit
LNASDNRNADSILEIAGNASQQGSLFGKKRVILIDEVDGLFGTVDRGGVKAIIDVIKNTKVPIILTANDPWAQKLRTLRNYVEMVQFKRLSSRDIVSILKFICDSEGVSYDIPVLEKIAEHSQGDARSAINDLQTIVDGRKVTLEDVDALGYRDKESDVFESMRMIFKSDPSEAYNATNVDKDLNELILWIEENISNEYEKPEEIAKAYNFISRADVFLGRIRRWQYFRFMHYASLLATVGVSASKKERYHKFTRFQPPTKILRLGGTKALRSVQKSISMKIAEHCHTSTRVAFQEFIPVLRFLIKKGKKFESLGLEPEEMKYLV